MSQDDKYEPIRKMLRYLAAKSQEAKPLCECGAKLGELHFQFCPAWQPVRSEG